MFRSRFLALFFLFSLSFAPSLFAQQTPADIPACFEGLDQATVGVPYYCDYGTALNTFLAPFFDASTGVSLSFTFNATAGTTLPPGMTMTQSGVFSGTPTTAGSFNYSIDINFKISFQGETITQAGPFPTVLVVNTAANGATRIDPGGLVFSFNQGSAASSQIVALSSRRNTPITWTATATTSTGGNWLSINGTGTINPFLSSIAIATANPNGLTAGTYSGAIAFTLSSGENFTVPVVLTVTSSQQKIVISQSGLFFQSVQGGSAPPAQPISVLNGGSGSINFSAAATTVSGGNWLSVAPSAGTASPSAAGSIAVTANPAGLAPGAYYGQIKISAPNVANSPQTSSVVLVVSSPAQSPGPSLSSTGAILVQIGATAAKAKTITIANPSPNPLTYSSTVFSDNGTSFYSVSPANGTLTGSQPLSLSVQPASGLAPGVYTGNLTLIFSDATTQTVYQRRVAVVFIVVSSAGASLRGPGFAPHAVGCTPTKLIPVMTQLGDGFKVASAWPTPLEVTVVDDCGIFLTSGGTVITTFSTGDPPLALASLQDGRWSATWVPRNTSSKEVTITAQAQEAVPALRGTAQIGGSLQANPSVPSIFANGVVSAASSTQRQPIAPGSYIAIYGQNLNPGAVVAQSLPLQTNLGGTQALLAGTPLPLNFAGSGQVNALVPFDAPVNTTLQLIIQQNGQLSVPEPVVLAPAQPAIFTQDLTPSGPAVVRGYKADGSANFVVDATHPVSVGDTLVIYCTGLGPVDQQVAIGDAGPISPLAQVLSPVTATVGGQPATISYAGLAPTLTVYQVNLVVPPGVAAGTDVPVVMLQAGQQSVPVTIAVK